MTPSDGLSVSACSSLPVWTAGIVLLLLSSSATAEKAPRLLRQETRVVLRVDDVDAGARCAQQSVARHHGAVRSSDGSAVRAEVAPSRLEQVLESLRSCGALGPRTSSAFDIADQVSLLQAQAQAAQDKRARLQELATRDASTSAQLQVAAELEQVDHELMSLGTQEQALRLQAATASLEVSLEPRREPTPEIIGAFSLPVPWLQDLGLHTLLDTTSQSAGSEMIESAADMALELRVTHLLDQTAKSQEWTSFSVGPSIRGVVGADPVGASFGFDMGLGAGFSGGFLYDLRLLLGPGFAIGRHLTMGVIAGAGVSGLTGDHVPAGLELPIELMVGVDMGSSLRAVLWGRPAWVVAADARQDGSNNAPFGDELTTGLSVLVSDGSRETESTGLRLGVAYGEMMGARTVTLSVGFGASFVDVHSD